MTGVTDRVRHGVEHIVADRVDTSRRKRFPSLLDARTLTVGAIAALLVAITGIAALWDGQHIEPRDSPTYLAAAEALADGDGYRVPFADRGKPVDFESSTSPVIDFPPGYPFVLSLAVRAGFDAVETARVVAIVSAAAIAVLFYSLTRARSGSRWAGLLVGLVAGLWTLRMSVAVLSEALFGLLISISLVSAGIFLRNRNARWLGLAALMAVMSVTVRTAGLAVVLAVAVAAWIGFTGTGRRLLWSGATLGAGLYAFAGLVASGNRVMAWHPPDMASIKITIDAFVSLIVPPVGSPTVRLALFAVVAGALAMLARPSRAKTASSSSTGPRPGLIALIAAVAQIGLVLATRALFDAQTDLNPRLMFPIALSLLIAGAEYSSRARWLGRPGRLRAGVVVVAVLALVSAGWRTGAEAAELRAPDGLRWASTGFQESEAVAYLEERAAGTTVFSNIPDGLWIVGVDGARALPTTYDPLSLRPNDELDAEMTRLGSEVAGGAVVFYDRDSDFGYLVEEPELREIAPCVVVDDGRSVVLTAADGSLCES